VPYMQCMRCLKEQKFDAIVETETVNSEGFQVKALENVGDWFIVSMCPECQPLAIEEEKERQAIHEETVRKWEAAHPVDVEILGKVGKAAML
jgi:hypothetical protein